MLNSKVGTLILLLGAMGVGGSLALNMCFITDYQIEAHQANNSIEALSLSDDRQRLEALNEKLEHSESMLSELDELRQNMETLSQPLEQSNSENTESRQNEAWLNLSQALDQLISAIHDNVDEAISHE